MFSKEDSKRLRQDFWISFGKSYPHKWILYNTRIKGLSLKFHFELKRAMVSIDIEHSDLATRIHLWEKLISLKPILTDEYLPEAVFDDALILDNNKEISRIFIEKYNVSIHNKSSWQETMVFLNEKMNKLEAFFMEYKDFLEP